MALMRVLCCSLLLAPIRAAAIRATSPLVASPPLGFSAGRVVPPAASAPPAAGVGQCTVRWFTQQIDHFSGYVPGSGELGVNTSAPTTFQQRYFWCDAHWSKDAATGERGPVFFYTGNEANVELYVNATGLMWENAEAFGALLVFVESRFYGESRPWFGRPPSGGGWAPVSYAPWQLQYLSAEQILADYATVARAVRAAESGAADSAIVAFGGSLGGMYASWLRMKYPSAVDGAIAASAPILSFGGEAPASDVGGYAAGVTYDATPAAGTGAAPACADNVRAAWKELFAVGRNASGYGELASAFRLCPRAGGGAPVASWDDVYALAYWAQAAFDYMAMGNFPYVSDYILNDEGSLPAFPVTEACKPLADAALKDDGAALLRGLRAAVSVYYNYSIGRAGPQPQCFDIHAGVNNASKEVDFLWNFQYCSEVFQVASRDGVRDMFFAQPWNAAASARGCVNNAAYGGVVPRQAWFTTLFGGRDIQASNIVFSNGKLDPWARQGVLPANATHAGGGVGVAASEVGPGSVALLIDLAAHHLDLFFANAQDPSSVVAARKAEMDMVRRWIAERKEKGARAQEQLRSVVGAALLW
eukprot:g1756.t1